MTEPTDRPVRIVEYDPEWPAMYERQAARVRAALGDRVRLLEHIGSTSVPGLAAKPLIDMLLVVDDTADEPAYVPDLEAAGFPVALREPDWYEHRMFKGPEFNTNLHTVSVGCPEIDRWLIMRDRLRANESERELYLATKRELAAREPNVRAYADAKTEIVEAIIARALAERS